MGNLKGIAHRPEKKHFVVKCPKCGKDIMITWDFCRHCGAELIPMIKLSE